MYKLRIKNNFLQKSVTKCHKTPKRDPHHTPKNPHPKDQKMTTHPTSQPTQNQPWFTPTPYPYQLAGALQLAYTPRRLLADEPGLGKTIQALLAASITNPTHTLIICPPSLTTNWQNETTRTQIHTHHHHTHTPQTITAQNHKKTTHPEKGILILADSLLSTRNAPTITQTLTNWKPDLIIIDEAHRYKNPHSKRTRNLLKLTHHTPTVYALTGTPIISSPLDLLPILKATHTLHNYPTPYVDTYCVQNYFGDWEPRPSRLPDLHARLDATTWIRRTKTQVLTELPSKTRTAITIDVDTSYVKEICQGVDTTSDTQLLTAIARLRRATGLAKTTLAAEHIHTHLTGTGRPIIAWTIHRQVSSELKTQLEHYGHTVAVYDGATPNHTRDQIVARFQAGQIDVLIANITAAGVGLTLTHASDAVFVETEWTPALVAQAEDRIHRISQTQPVTITTLVAAGTLDPIIHRILAEKIDLLDQITPDSDHKVTTLKTDQRITQLIQSYQTPTRKNPRK